MQTGLIGLKAEAIAQKKWGIATDKSAHLASGSCLLGSCLLGSWFLRGEYSSHQCLVLSTGKVKIVLNVVSSLIALIVIYCQLVAILDS
jgi:hypothetical protein